MKKRICFAGFNDAEVEALQPELSSVSSSWECVFCKDGPSALETMAQGPCAAMVADLRMQGMSGVGLLQLIAGDFPHTLRFALGDVTDREAVVTNIGSPHQFISRPWRLTELVVLVERSLALDAWLSSDKLRKFVPQLGRLPGLPATYFEVLKRAESPNSSVEEIGQIISRDPALTARVLQTVNSAAAAMGEKITNPVEAVSVLGMDTVKSLVLCLQVFNQSAATLPTGITLDDLWRHSFAVAQLSRKITLLQTSNTRMASDAFTAGLLHRVGQIVLTTNLAKEYAEIVRVSREENQLLHEVEKARLGLTSAQIGAYLLGLWGMPLTLIEADALYNEPELVTAREFSLLTAVHVANVLAQEERPLADKVPVSKLSREYLKALKLPEKSEAWKKALAGGQFSDPSAASEEKEPEREGGERGSPPPLRLKTYTPPKKSNLVWAVVAVVVIAAAFVAWKKFVPVMSPKASVAPVATVGTATPDAQIGTTSNSTPEPAQEPPSVTEAFDALQIQGIIYSPSRPVALINTKPVSPGDKINGVTISAITRSNVLVTCEGFQRILKWQK
jgi:HD-like signal output (HDOD) protein/CheY-like chemotaxis protein